MALSQFLRGKLLRVNAVGSMNCKTKNLSQKSIDNLYCIVFILSTISPYTAGLKAKHLHFR